MLRRLWPAVLLVTLSAPAGFAQTPTATDKEVVKGIQLVENGEFDEAIVTLDLAVARLQKVPSAHQDLTQAYLYLGVAYLGKGHESAAKARFREALAQVKDLKLTSEKFAPKVIELFEQAKAESGPAAAPKPTAAASPAPAAGPPQKKGGSKTPILIGVGVAVVGAGVAVAAGGGGDGGSASPTTTQATQPVEAQYYVSGGSTRETPIEVGGILRVRLGDQMIGEYSGGPNPIPAIGFRGRPGTPLQLQARTLGDGYFMSRLVLWKMSPTGEVAPHNEAPPIPFCSLPNLRCPVPPNPNGTVFFEVTWPLP